MTDATDDARRHDLDDVAQLDRLRLALLHERSRAEDAERQLASLRAQLADRRDGERAVTGADRPSRRLAGIVRRRR